MGKMPKETFYSRYAAIGAFEPVAALSWGRDSEHVQLGVGMPTAHFEELCGLYEAKIRNAMTPSGVEIAPRDVAALARAMASEAIELDGFYFQFDRNSANGFIRALRKARDQAFGADA